MMVQQSITMRCAPRRLDLDRAKGVGIVLVVVGHSTPPEILATVIYGFHMPLFFVISGLLWRDVVRPRSSAWTLMQPFYIASTLSWILWVGKQLFYKSDGVPLWGPLVATIYATDWHGYFVHNAPLWFLPAMLSTLLLIWLAQWVASPPYAVSVVACMGIAVMGIETSADWFASLPFYAGQGLVGAVFFAAGRLIRDVNLPELDVRSQYAMVAVGIIVYLFVVTWQGRVDLRIFNFGNPVVYIFNGLLGSALVLWFCRRRWPAGDSVGMLGRHSLLILVTHLPLLWLVRAIVQPIFLEVPWWTITAAAVFIYWVLFCKLRIWIRPVMHQRSRSQEE
jgi:fucose 4-O-acetylase-like acetyltransferase